jgi:hypothetical protein
MGAATATHNEIDRAMTKISVFEIRLPITGSRPTTKVETTSVLANGKHTPNSGSTMAEWRMPERCQAAIGPSPSRGCELHRPSELIPDFIALTYYPRSDTLAGEHDGETRGIFGDAETNSCSALTILNRAAPTGSGSFGGSPTLPVASQD